MNIARSMLRWWWTLIDLSDGMGSEPFPRFPNLIRPLTAKEVMEQVLPELTRRIVALAHPTRIILFGSAARNELGPDSDLDVLVVMPDGADCKETCGVLYRKLRIGFAKDILVVTEGDLAIHGDKPWLIYLNALKDGRELYRANPDEP